MPGDWYTHLLHAKTGKIGYIDKVMAVYRRQPKGVWYNSFKDNIKLNLEYGVEKINFHRLVWENFANKSPKYLNNVLLPTLKEVLQTHFAYGNFDKCIEIKKENFELVEKIIPINNLNRLRHKYEKYKKLFFILISLTIFLSSILLWGIFR